MVFRKHQPAQQQTIALSPLFRLGHMHALLPGYSRAPLCEVIIGRSKTPSRQLGLNNVHTHGLYVVDMATPPSFAADEDILESLETFWRAGEILKRFDAYEPINNEVVKLCCNAAGADQNPANLIAQRFIKEVTSRIGVAAYLEIIRLSAPLAIRQAQQENRRVIEAAAAARDRKHGWRR